MVWLVLISPCTVLCWTLPSPCIGTDIVPKCRTNVILHYCPLPGCPPGFRPRSPPPPPPLGLDLGFGFGCFSYALGLGLRLRCCGRSSPWSWSQSCSWSWLWLCCWRRRAATARSRGSSGMPPSESESASDEEDESSSEDDSSEDSPTWRGAWYMQQTSLYVLDSLDYVKDEVDKGSRVCIPLDRFRPSPSLSTTDSAHCTRWSVGG